MAKKLRRFTCPPDDVFRVLADGWLYPVWVVGATRMRDVEAHWPSPGARLHHSVGIWPVMLNDTTTVVEWEPPKRAVFRARGWPIGEAHVSIEVYPTADGCAVQIVEDAIRGPATWVAKPLRSLALNARNRETLRRLAYIAEGMRRA